MALPVFKTAELPADAVEIGSVGDAWGLRGWLKIWPYSSYSDTLSNTTNWYLKVVQAINFAHANHQPKVELTQAARYIPVNSTKQTAILSAGVYQPQIQHLDRQGQDILVKFVSVDSRNQAELLKGNKILIARQDFPPLAAEEYYWVDLIGLTVVNLENQILGTVETLQEHGAQTLLAVKTSAAVAQIRGDNQQLLIPFVANFIKTVDFAKRCICVDWQADF